DKNVPESLFDKTTANEIYKTGVKNDLGIAISNFRESSKYIYFSYGRNIMVVFDKETATSTMFRFVHNGAGKVNFENYYGHDGDDDLMLSIYDAPSFHQQMKAYQSSGKDWLEMPEYVKELAQKTDEKSNPFLVIY